MSDKKPKKRNALGRGLGALLDDSVVFETPINVASGGNMTAIPLEQIEANPFQPRTKFDQQALSDLARERFRARGG